MISNSCLQEHWAGTYRYDLVLIILYFNCKIYYIMPKRHLLCSSGSIYRAFFVGKTNLNGLFRKTAMLFVPAP